MSEPARRIGHVSLVGAGPGDPGLITVRGLERIRRADVIVHDRLVASELLALAAPHAEVIDVGKSRGERKQSQEAINALLIQHARDGSAVVRLKGGDPFVFGRGCEELAACRAAGIACEVVPGVTSALAAPAAAGVPVTCRGIARGIAIVTAETGDGECNLDFAALAAMDTVVILMGRARLAEVAARLIRAGRSAATPVACIERATTPRQRVVTGALDHIADRAETLALQAPVVIVVGEVARFACDLQRAVSPKSTLVHSPEPGPERPARGKRIVLTGSRSINRRLRRRLDPAGAIVIECPLVRIDYQTGGDESERILASLNSYDWVFLTSVHGARGFIRALRMRGLDARALSAGRVAAIGPATARALRRGGIVADVTARTHTAAALAAEPGASVAGRRVLIPCGNLARAVLADALAARGALVDRFTVYRNEPAAVPSGVRSELRRGFDLAVLCSPSAMQRFQELEVSARSVPVACIGPTTAAAARDAGLHVVVEPAAHTAEGLARSIIEYFAAEGVAS